MKNQLRLSQLQETSERKNGCLNIDTIFVLNKLNHIIKKEYNPILLEYVPIKIVASFEDFFREKYKMIIDNVKFRNNIKEIATFKNISFDFDILGAFQDNIVTLGEYLSYLIPCSKFDDICSTLSKLLHIDFIETMEKESGFSLKVLESIKEIFRLRHIFCHEVQETEKLSYDKAEKLINDACSFLSVADEIINNILYPNSPQTTAKMLADVKQDFETSERELELLIETIKSKIQEKHLETLHFNYIDTWKQYRKERAKSESLIAEGGSMQQIIYLSGLDEITKAFIKELKCQYKYIIK